MTTPDVNKKIVLRYVEAFNNGDTVALRDLFTPDAVIQGVLGSAGIEEALRIWRELHQAFAIALTVDDLVAEDDRVAARYTERGVFGAPFRGTPPTGRSYEIVAMELFHFRDGRICRRWGARDSAAQARQIGL